MNFKRIMLITLLLLAVLMIGSVSAAEDVDALAVDDTGDETVVEAPVDEDATQTAVVDEDVVEAEENTDTLASPSASFYDEVHSEYSSVCFFSEYGNGINGTVSLFANETQVYNQEIAGEDYISIKATDIIGSFYGTYHMKIIYNGTDGANYEKEGTVNFTKAIINKVFTPDDFKVTFPASEIDIDKGDPVIITYFTPEGVKEHSSTLFVYYGDGEFDRQTFDMKLDDVGTYKNITWGDLYVYTLGVFNLSVRYTEDWQNFLELGNATINVTNKREYTAEDIITIYGPVDMIVEDCLADIYDDEVGGLNGVVTAYADDNQIYTKTYVNSTQGGPIHAKDLTGSLNGNYTVKIEYKRADGKVFELSKNVYFDNVGEPSTPDTRPWVHFDVKASDITFGDKLLVTFTEKDNIPFTGKVGVRIFDYTSNPFRQIASTVVDANNGTGSAEFSDLPAGTFTVDVYSNETDSYKAGYGEKEFTVKKALSRILFYDTIVDLDVGTPSNLTVKFEKASGITAKVDGENVTVNGSVIVIPALSMGTHTLEISTIPDDNHIEDTKEVTLNVTKPKSKIVLDGKFSFDKGSSTNITVTTKNAIDFNASIEGHPEALIRNGNVITISGLDVGSYKLNVTTIVDDDHLAVTEMATIKVNRLIATIEFSDDKIVFDEGSSGSIIANVSNGGISKAIIIAHKEAVIKIEGNKITVSNLTAGNYTLSVTSKPNTGYSANIKSIDVFVNPKTDVKTNSTVSVDDVVMDYGSSKNVPVTVDGATGFTAKIDGVDAVVQGSSVVVSGLDAGTHTLTVTTIPDDDHLAVSKNATITVNQLKTTVSASKVSVVYGNSKNIVVTLKDSNNKLLEGKYITVVLNGVTYKNKVTNSKGQVSIAVPKTLAVKTYSAILKFEGDKNYDQSNGKVSVVVSKATPKLTAKAKTFKKSVKTKKYTITLKTNTGKAMNKAKVTLKVNKKTYSGKTNSKGQITFKITNLKKKGKYTAVVKYAGNSYYKAVTAKPKITIK